MIHFQVTIPWESQMLLRDLPHFGRRALAAIAESMDEQNQLTIGDITVKRLNYPKDGPVIPDGLRHQSGLLKKSLRATPAVIVGGQVRSAISSNVRYAAAHEFGYQGSVTVPQHSRRQFRTVLQDRRTAKPPVYVPSTTRIRKGESAEAFIERSRAREALKRAAFEEKLSVWTYEQSKKMRYKRVKVGDVTVTTHQRQMNLPARRYVRGTLEDRAGAYTQDIGNRIADAWRNLGGGPAT